MSWFVEAAPTNGPDDADAAMAWVDITSYVNDRIQPVGATYGRQTELQAVQPGALTLTLNNGDHRFTAGNPTSPYYPGWRSGMRIRVRETIGGRSFLIFDGNMLQPDLTINNPGVDQQVVVNAVDRLGRLAAGAKFVSTLAEYIIYNGGSGLVAYWSLLDPIGSQAAASPGALRDPLRPGSPLIGSFIAPSGVMFSPGAGVTLPGDDRQGTLFTPFLNPDGSLIASSYLYATLSNPIAQSSGDTITVAYWVSITDTVVDLNVPVELVGHVSMQLMLDRTGGAGGTWALDTLAGAASASLPARAPANQSAMLIALRMSLPSGLVELWRHTDPIISGTMSGGAVPASATWDQVWVGQGFNGTLSHIQIYNGPTAYTRAMHLAQASAGYTGLYGQFAGQRITTLAQYAGMSPADLAIDTGTAAMQKASLAGKSPLQAMQEAADTDQGLLHAIGRKLVFHSRKRRYDL